MEAVILAAGRGSRLGQATDQLPKCMVQLGGRRLIDRCLDALSQVGIEKITLVGGYRKEILPADGLEIVHNDRWATTGIAYSMLQAAGRVNDSVVVCYGDIVFEPRVIQALLQEESSGVSITVNTDWLKLWRLRMSDVLSDAESLRRTSDWQITEIGRRASSLQDIQGQFMGLIGFDADTFPEFCSFYRQLLQSAPVGDESISQWDMTTLLNHWLRAGKALRGVPVCGGWLEVDTISDLALYARLQESDQLSAICRLE